MVIIVDQEDVLEEEGRQIRVHPGSGLIEPPPGSFGLNARR